MKRHAYLLIPVLLFAVLAGGLLLFGRPIFAPRTRIIFTQKAPWAETIRERIDRSVSLDLWIPKTRPAWSLENAPLAEWTEVVARSAGVNIAVDPALSGIQVNGKAEDAPLREILERVLKKHRLKALVMNEAVYFTREDASEANDYPGFEAKAAGQPAMKAVLDKLHRPISFDFSEAPLRDCIEFLQEVTALSITADPRSGDRLEVQISLLVEGMETGHSLWWLLRLGGCRMEANPIPPPAIIVKAR